jgi:hypothetical protein
MESSLDAQITGVDLSFNPDTCIQTCIFVGEGEDNVPLVIPWMQATKDGIFTNKDRLTTPSFYQLSKPPKKRSIRLWK